MHVRKRGRGYAGGECGSVEFVVGVQDERDVEGALGGCDGFVPFSMQKKIRRVRERPVRLDDRSSLCGCGRRRPRSWQSAKSDEWPCSHWRRDRFSCPRDRKNESAETAVRNTSMGSVCFGRRAQQVDDRGIQLALLRQAVTKFLQFIARGQTCRTTTGSRFLRRWSCRPVRECRCRGRPGRPGRHRCNRCWRWWRPLLPDLWGHASLVRLDIFPR